MAGLTKEQREAKKAAKALEAANAAASKTTETEDPTMDKVTGSPAVEHQKKIQKKIAAEKKIAKPFKQFFTLKDGKLLSVKVKKNGAYSTFVGSKAKMEKKEKGSFDAQIRAWKKVGAFVSEDAYEDKVLEFKEQLGE